MLSKKSPPQRAQLFIKLRSRHAKVRRCPHFHKSVSSPLHVWEEDSTNSSTVNALYLPTKQSVPDFCGVLCSAVKSSWNPEALLSVQHQYLPLYSQDRGLIPPISQSHRRKFNGISSELAFETCFSTAMKSCLFNGQLPLLPSSKFAVSEESLPLKTENNRNFGKYIVGNAKGKMCFQSEKMHFK